MRLGSQRENSSELGDGGKGRVRNVSQNLGLSAAQAGPSLSTDCQHL